MTRRSRALTQQQIDDWHQPIAKMLPGDVIHDTAETTGPGNPNSAAAQEALQAAALRRHQRDQRRKAAARR